MPEIGLVERIRYALSKKRTSKRKATTDELTLATDSENFAGSNDRSNDKLEQTNKILRLRASDVSNIISDKPPQSSADSEPGVQLPKEHSYQMGTGNRKRKPKKSSGVDQSSVMHTDENGLRDCNTRTYSCSVSKKRTKMEESKSSRVEDNQEGRRRSNDEKIRKMSKRQSIAQLCNQFVTSLSFRTRKTGAFIVN